jgi:hypothetical protein
METCVFLGQCLRLTTPFGPPLPSSCQIVKQGSNPNLVNVKLLVLSDTEGTISAGLWACVYLITVKVIARGDTRGLWRDASGLHPQHWYCHIYNLFLYVGKV